MQLKKIKVNNFRSFDELDMELNRFNVLIGANASGKSNFINIFKFLNDISTDGLENAISLQGGAEYLTNINLGVEKNLSIDLYVDFSDKPIDIDTIFDKKGRMQFVISTYKLMYSFTIEFHGAHKEYRSRVAEERLIFSCKLKEFKAVKVPEKTIRKDEEGKEIEAEEMKIKYKEVRVIDSTISLKRGKDEITYEITPEGIIRPEDVFLLSSLKMRTIEVKTYPKELILRNIVFSSFQLRTVTRFLNNISIYDIQPNLLQKYTLATGKTELEPDGKNLALILRKILNNKVRRQKFFMLIKDFLPFVEDIRVKFSDKYLSTDLKETYSERFLPAFLMSEGTIIIVALIVVLYFEKKPIIIIEELERHFHPHLIAKVIDMMQDVSERMDKQILITTHNPEIVRYGGIKNILLVHRNDEGFSKVSRPAEKKEVQTFLKNKMGIEELYVQNLLEW